MSKFVITAEDVGRLARTRDGKVVQITKFNPVWRYAVTAREVGREWTNSWTGQGVFDHELGYSGLDLVEFVEDEQEDKEMQYEPFDLERALAGEPVILRDGRKAYVRHYESELNAGGLGQLIGYVETDKPTMAVLSWRKDGVSARTLSDIVGMYPQYKLIHGVKVPVFPDWGPKIGETVNLVRLDIPGYVVPWKWEGNGYCKMLLERGLVYPHTKAGEQAAILHAKAMLGIAEDNDAIN